jgi:predicted nucleic acid-binding protein
MTMAWCLEDEATPFTDRVCDSLSTDSQAIVPSIWPLEVANVFLIAERQSRIAEAKVARFIALLKSLPIEIDYETPRRSWSDILALAREYRLSSYDAAYLELAMRQRIPLATLDAPLRRAATRLGVSLLDGS